VNNGVVLKIGDRIEVLREDGVPTRVIFDRIPENLRAQPTLSVTVDSAKAGVRPAKLNYLTNGLSWKADYVALFDESAGKLDLQGWVTLTNTSGVDYRDAQVQMVAGDINLVRGLSEWNQRYRQARRGQARAGTETGSGSVADYYVYPLRGRTTVANNQTKQVSFLDVGGAKARKVYAFSTDEFQSLERPASADVALEFANSASGGLGAQLPAGVVRVYVRDSGGESKFIGENRIDHTPQGSQVSVKTGEAFDVTVQPTLVSNEAIPGGRRRYVMSYVLRNARPQPVVVNLRQGGLWRDSKVYKESQPSQRLDASTLGWDVPVPANGETTLTFTVGFGW